MFKLTALALAAAVSTAAVVPSTAMAIDNGPCDHCTMEPIVVKGDRPEKENDTVETGTQQLQVGQPASTLRMQIPTIGKPTVPATNMRN